MKILVGSTGFVGSNLLNNMDFDAVYNSKNIKMSYDTNPDLLVYAGVRGTKFLANKYPEKDAINIKDAINNIKKINAKKIILISTVDVYNDLDGKDEDYIIDGSKLHSYGKNRYDLEQWVINNISDYHIIRLPAIYGINLKKNFVHDLIYPAPTYLTKEIYEKIFLEFNDIEKYYSFNDELYSLVINDQYINSYFHQKKYNSLVFTDSRSEYQYFNLEKLNVVIKEVINMNIRIFNCVTEPIKSDLLYREIYSNEFINEIHHCPIKYNLKTKWNIKCFKNRDGYLMNKEEEIKELINFIRRYKND